MNPNIEIMLQKLLKNEELCKKLSKINSFDEVYEFCTEIHGGYTQEELEAFMGEVLESYIISSSEMDDTDMKRVSGGTNSKLSTKALAYSLSALMAFGYADAFVPRAHAADGAVAAASAPAEKKGFSFSEFWKNNKKKIITGIGITAGALILAVGGYYLFKNKKASSKQADNQPGAIVKSPDVGANVSADAGAKSGGADAVSADAGAKSGGADTVSATTHKGIGQEWLDKLSNKIYNNRWLYYPMGVISFASLSIENLARFYGKLSKIGSGRYVVNDIISSVKNRIERKKREWENKELNSADAIKNFDTVLCKEIKGQEKAKKSIRSYIYTMLSEKATAKRKGETYNKADVFYFVGPTGVGKTFMATKLAEDLVLSSYGDYYYISASSVDTESKDTIVDQLFGLNSYNTYSSYMNMYGSADTGGRPPAEQKSLVKYISEHPKDGVVIIDEYDKMWSKNLDEIFRTASERGKIEVKGQVIDCTGITFILTSNETNESVNLPDDNDQTGSRTVIKHDKSFLTRLHRVAFESLTPDTYSEVIRQEFGDFVVAAWKHDNISADDNLPQDVDIVIDDECVEKIANQVKKVEEGARYITNELVPKLNAAVLDKIVEAKEKHGTETYYRGKKLYVFFEPGANRGDEQFFVNEEPVQ